jgi:hypothetical protein
MPSLAFWFGKDPGGARFIKRLPARAAEMKSYGIFGVALQALHRNFIRTVSEEGFFCWWERSRIRIAPPCLPGRFCDRLDELQIEGV